MTDDTSMNLAPARALLERLRPGGDLWKPIAMEALAGNDKTALPKLDNEVGEALARLRRISQA